MAKKDELYWNVSVIEDLLHIKVYYQMKVWELYLPVSKFNESILDDYFSTVPNFKEMKSEVLRDVDQAVRISKRDRRVKFYNDVFRDALFIGVTVVVIIAVMIYSCFSNC